MTAETNMMQVDTMYDLGKVVREKRLQTMMPDGKPMTLYDLGYALGIRESYVSRLENRERDWTLPLLQRLLKTFPDLDERVHYYIKSRLYGDQ